MKKPLDFCIIRFLISSCLILTSMFLQAQTSEPWLWPIEGQKAGSGILYCPQGYIEKEFNYDHLVIGAPEGANVVCPVDGTVVSVAVSYQQSLDYLMYFRNPEISKSFDALIESVGKDYGEKNKSADLKFLSGQIGIKTADGKTVYIHGLTGERIFKTGQKIKRGEVIGKVAYWYFQVKASSICVTVSEKIASDPMTPFGIKTTFIKAEDVKPVKSLTVAQAKEDFLTFIDILRDAYPGLYDVLSEEELVKFTEKSVSELEGIGHNSVMRKVNNISDSSVPVDSLSISYSEFRPFMYRVLSTIHDSHFYIQPSIWNKDKGYSNPDYQPAVYWGWFDDTLRITRATKEYEKYKGAQVISVNGITADSVKRIINSYTDEYESKVEDYPKYMLALWGMGNFFMPPYGTKKYDMLLELSDGTKLDIKGVPSKKRLPAYTTDFIDFVYINYYPEGYSHKMLNDSTAYLGLYTFQLNQTQIEDVVSFIDSVSTAARHLIIDVRNNAGGEVTVLNRIFSCIADDTLKVNGEARVNRKGGFPSMKYSLNYSFSTSDAPEDEIFPEFSTREGKSGFYSDSDDYTIRTLAPDSLVHFPGNVYVLTNENSISAATLLPAMVLRSHRGVIVGRETRTAYHFMNAMKFSDFRLPNSTITINVPLVHLVFDNAVVERTPYGRGVIPDYYVPLTLAEFEFRDGDAILNRALELIAQGQYLSPEDPFEAIDNPPVKSGKPYLLIAIVCAAVGAIIALLIFLLRRRLRK